MSWPKDPVPVSNSIIGLHRLHEFTVSHLTPRPLCICGRRGKLVSLGPGEAASLPTGEPVLVYGPCVVAVQASFEAVGAGIVGEVVVDGLGAVPEFIFHAYDGGRMLRAVGRIGAGRHHIQLLFRHCGMDERQPRGYVFGPARVEFWRYPSEAIVWMDEHAALQNTAAWVRRRRSLFNVMSC